MIHHLRSGRAVGFWWVVAPAVLALISCEDDSPVEPHEPAAIVQVSGNAQEGKAGEPLAQPFVVRVTDARGDGVEGAEVSWRLTSGAGRWGDGKNALQGLETTTNTDGVARALFLPTALGTSTVDAGLGDHGLRVGFTTEATVMVIRVDVLFSCLEGPSIFAGPEGSTEVTIPVGSPVEWTPACHAHVTSTDSPPGGRSVDTGTLTRGERFRFVPATTGTWKLVDRVYGATGSLTAR